MRQVLFWSAFTATTDATALACVAVHVAAGRSLYEAVKSGLMRVPLTRDMCHDFLSSGGDAGFLDAVRRAQVRAAGGNARLHGAWVATRAGRRLHDRAGEVFWHTVLVWLGSNPMLPVAEVGPLVDYIDYLRGEDPALSMKGRGVLALLRGMRQWHGELARESAVRGRVFAPSGFEPLEIDLSRRNVKGERVIEVWHVREVLDARTLADEGRAMSHCVYSYARHRASGVRDLDAHARGQHWSLAETDDRGPPGAAAGRPGTRPLQSHARAARQAGARRVGGAQRPAGVPGPLTDSLQLGAPRVESDAIKLPG